MASGVRRPAKLEMPVALEDSVQDGLGEIRVVEDPAPGGERFVRGKDHGAVMPVAFVDDVEEHVGGVGSLAEVADFVDDQHARMRVGGQGMAELALARGDREVIDERGGRGEPEVSRRPRISASSRSSGTTTTWTTRLRLSRLAKTRMRSLAPEV